MNRSKLFEKIEEMKELLGAEALLNEICQGLSSDELYAALEYTSRMHDMGLFDESTEEND
jgi:hypothetical protein